ncbi:Coenzyme F420 hydrogenase/dehydrogenase, beta subunit C-terminal domain [Robinsoniella peoriensis]|uniref:Formate hydrogenlyase complex iron-sulfur subunit n=1 Tax=Robinsoniella peoriensis TaxID=180332 RepID=A0A4U8QAT1_9FIRM|nr:Coenzyme F420 hydrogenase/dehydrogenase, beta subunit C-terminal domain [Robinsoniella peoriensis]MDU7028124.1 Coenzyme F420 hydrogenase/dehydrogenase, beta subunit C-terminal domain [Clostridiales bacterium]TLD01353.1 formate hydrogenlyase complex iron-sulfur subunit [Robinsoniella peoriensis]
MLKLLKKSDCCGCSACSLVCPKQCIEMKADEEGFLYPEIREEQCIGCNRCDQVCPIVRYKDKEVFNSNKKAFIVQNRDEDILKKSTSGGFFSSLAKYVILNKGVVFGAAYDSDFKVKHTMIDTLDKIELFRNSKYTQSDINKTYKTCKCELQTGRLVCFSGTACQIAGLISFLGIEYKNLITVDVVCRGVPSPLLFEKYITWCGGKEKIQSIKFRDKHYGYYCSTMSVYYKDGNIKRNEIHSDPMLNFFFNSLCSRPTCHECVFKTKDRYSDFTMFDCWHANKLAKGFSNNGATALVLRNSKAEKIWDEISDKNFKFAKVDFDKLVELDGKLMISCVPENANRAAFFKTLNRLSFDEVINEFNSYSMFDKIKICIKKWLMCIGIFEKYMERKFR